MLINKAGRKLIIIEVILSTKSWIPITVMNSHDTNTSITKRAIISPYQKLKASSFSLSLMAKKTIITTITPIQS